MQPNSHLHPSSIVLSSQGPPLQHLSIHAVFTKTVLNCLSVKSDQTLPDDTGKSTEIVSSCLHPLSTFAHLRCCPRTFFFQCAYIATPWPGVPSLHGLAIATTTLAAACTCRKRTYNYKQTTGSKAAQSTWARNENVGRQKHNATDPPKLDYRASTNTSTDRSAAIARRTFKQVARHSWQAQAQAVRQV
jgi:hypothetical protein